MAASDVCVAGEYIELDVAMIDGALDLMALTCGNNLDQETIKKAEKFKRIVAKKLEGEFRDKKLRVKRVGPGSSSGASDIQPSTSLVEPGPSSSRAIDQPASTSRASPGPSSAIRTEESRPRTRPSLPKYKELTGLFSVPIRKQFAASDVCSKATTVQANVAEEADKKNFSNTYD